VTPQGSTEDNNNLADTAQARVRDHRQERAETTQTMRPSNFERVIKDRNAVAAASAPNVTQPRTPFTRQRKDPRKQAHESETSDTQVNVLPGVTRSLLAPAHTGKSDADAPVPASPQAGFCSVFAR
jgi:hypothetical protein